jgi:dihydroneopterin aldolase
MKLTESYIILRSLKFHAFHGVMPQEQVTGNDYTVDLKIGYDVAKAAETDNVDDTIDYAAVYHIVSEEMSVSSRLLEHVCYRIAQRLMKTYSNTTSIAITLTKVNPPMGADSEGAAVEMLYTNKD